MKHLEKNICFTCETPWSEMQEKTYDLNIESALLSSIIFDPSLLKKYADKIDENVFFLPYHQKIYKTIIDLYRNDKPIDEEIIKNRLGSNYEDILINILSSTPMTILDGYIEILKDLTIKREIQKISKELAESIDKGESGIALQAKLQSFSENISSKHTLELLEIEKLSDIEEKEIEFIVENWLPIPKRTVSLVTAPGGTGKSWFIMQLAIRAVMEKKINKAFLWLSEDPKEISKSRFKKIMLKILNSNDEDIEEKIAISDSPTLQFLYEEQRGVAVSPFLQHFKAKMEPYDLIILDPLIAFYGADENNNSQARRFMQLFTDWANKEDKTIIFIHHSTKNTTQSRGASAFVDAVRTVYEIDKIKDSDGKPKEDEEHKRIIKLTKDNYGIGKLLKSIQVERQLFPKREKIVYEEIVYDMNKINGIPEDF